MEQGSTSPDAVKLRIVVQLIKRHVDNRLANVLFCLDAHFNRTVYCSYVIPALLEIQAVTSGTASEIKNLSAFRYIAYELILYRHHIGAECTENELICILIIIHKCFIQGCSSFSENRLLNFRRFPCMYQQILRQIIHALQKHMPLSFGMSGLIH